MQICPLPFFNPVGFIMEIIMGHAGAFNKDDS
jgi:hypothetical protein